MKVKLETILTDAGKEFFKKLNVPMSAPVDDGGQYYKDHIPYCCGGRVIKAHNVHSRGQLLSALKASYNSGGGLIFATLNGSQKRKLSWFTGVGFQATAYVTNPNMQHRSKIIGLMLALPRDLFVTKTYDY